MKWRMMAAVMAASLLALLVQDIPLSFYLKSAERDRIVTALERDAFVLAGRSEESMESNSSIDNALVSGLARDYRDAGGARVVIVNAAGIALVTSDDDATAVGQSYASRPEIAKALAGQITTGERYSTTLDQRLLYVSVPILSGSSVIGAVRLTYPAQIIDDAAAARQWTLWTAALTSTLVAGIIGLIFSTTVTRRLALLRTTTEQLAAGRIDERADETSGAPELRSLSHSFNIMAERLTASLEQQRNFSSDASHQLRTPLTALRLRLERAKLLVPTDPDGAVERLDAAETEVDRLSGIIEGLLVLSRVEASAVPTEPTDIAAVAAARVAHWLPLAQESDITISYRGPAAAMVLAVPGGAEQIIDNFIDNAVSACAGGGSILVTVAEEGGSTAVHVIDDGPGMSEQERGQAFDRFWRGSSSQPGSGLGLAIVARLATLSLAAVRLDGAPGGGVDARVTFTRAGS